MNDDDNPYQSPLEQGAKRGMNYLLWAKIQFVTGGIILLLDATLFLMIVVSGVYAGLPALLLSVMGGSFCIFIGFNNLRLHELRKDSTP